MDRTIEITVNGEKISVNTREFLDINDINNDMDAVAAQLGYWGALWAEAEKEKEVADAFYRQWRAEEGEKICLREPKTSEWKIKQKLEANPKFIKIKASLGEAIKNSVLCKVICDALKVKANMLQSKGANLRHEIESGGMTTKAKKSKNVKEDKVDSNTKNGLIDDRREIMKKIFRAKKK